MDQPAALAANASPATAWTVTVVIGHVMELACIAPQADAIITIQEMIRTMSAMAPVPAGERATAQADASIPALPLPAAACRIAII